MEGLRVWAASVCAAALVCGLIYRLFPDNSLGKQGRMLLPCLFLLAVLLPLKGLNISVDFTEEFSATEADASALTARLRQQTTAYVNNTLLAMVNQALDSYDVAAKKVTADVHFTQDGGIEMGQITVYIDKQALNMAAVVRQIAEKRLGTAVMLAQWEDGG